jgi:hypothetical protein
MARKAKTATATQTSKNTSTEQIPRSSLIIRKRKIIGTRCVETSGWPNYPSKKAGETQVASLGLPHMHRLFTSLILLHALVLAAHGMSVEIPVTPNNLEQNKYAFLVSTNTGRNGITFHVTITAKTGDIPSDSTADLNIVTITKDGGAMKTVIRPVNPPTRVILKKEKRVWQADFTVSRKSLKKAGICFVFTEFAHTTIDGKSVSMPSADLYQIKLHDFL